MNCKYCDKELKGKEKKLKVCFTCYDKRPFVRRLVAKCNQIKRSIGYDRG